MSPFVVIVAMDGQLKLSDGTTAQRQLAAGRRGAGEPRRAEGCCDAKEVRRSLSIAARLAAP
jgi:hypothetical protein